MLQQTISFFLIAFLTFSCSGELHGARPLDAGIAAIAKARQATPETWNRPHEPFMVYGNTYYVGTVGLSSLLITSPQGHILIDGALPESAALIAKNIQTLGFKLKDIKFILSSHAHFDHAGGIAELQAMSGATVVGSASSIKAMQTGQVATDDPQFGSVSDYPMIHAARIVADGEVLRLGALALTAHYSPGHTPGGIT